MATDSDRLKTAQWVLDRNLAWIAAADSKVGVIVAGNTAMLGGLAAAVSKVAVLTAWPVLLSLMAAGAQVVAILCAATAVLPRVDGPKRSLVFFGRVADLNPADYQNKFRSSTDAELLDDVTAQIHRNAEIACRKHGLVRKALWWSFISGAPWLVALAMLVKP